MKNKLNIALLTVLMLSSVTASYCQLHLIKKANEHYDKFEYIDAQKDYIKAIKKGAKSAEVYKNLGNSYYYNGQYEDASQWYNNLLYDFPDQVDPEYYFRYAQSLKSLEKYDEADVYMSELAKQRPYDLRVKVFNENKDYLKKIDSLSGYYNILSLTINSPYSDFGTTFYGDSILFSSTRKLAKNEKQIHQWNKESYLDFYETIYDSVYKKMGKVKKWNDFFNSPYHESTAVFTKDRKTLYFTRNSIKGKKYQQYKTFKLGTDRLKIFRSQINSDGHWSEPEELPFNDDAYSVAHPTLNIKEDKLYFSSDMPGGYGESDLYEVSIDINGQFGSPRNLGRDINTEGKETFPFMSVNGDLYFSSDARGGLGGLDVYVWKSPTDSPLTYEILNIGRPINSPYDDFAFVIDEDKEIGFFSSNRPGGRGKDDIYGIVPEPFKPGEDLAIILNLQPIYFDLDKSYIRADAAMELNKIIKVLKENPRLKIDIRSHTDSRASYLYNINLSQRRAMSTEKYLIEHGINSKRLSKKGYGESQLINKCKDGVYCSEDKHQLNRRSEFIIMK